MASAARAMAQAADARAPGVAVEQALQVDVHRAPPRGRVPARSDCEEAAHAGDTIASQDVHQRAAHHHAVGQRPTSRACSGVRCRSRPRRAARVARRTCATESARPWRERRRSPRSRRGARPDRRNPGRPSTAAARRSCRVVGATSRMRSSGLAWTARLDGGIAAGRQVGEQQPGDAQRIRHRAESDRPRSAGSG